MSLEFRRTGCLERSMILLSSSRTLGVFKASAVLESSATSAITNLPNSIVRLFLGLSSGFSCALVNNSAMVLIASFLSIFLCCGSSLCSFSSPARILPISSLACWRRLVGVLGNSIISAPWGCFFGEVSEYSSLLCLRSASGNSTILALGVLEIVLEISVHIVWTMELSLHFYSLAAYLSSYYTIFITKLQ